MNIYKFKYLIQVQHYRVVYKNNYNNNKNKEGFWKLLCIIYVNLITSFISDYYVKITAL